MSEYQYYEFQAIDRPLTSAEMSELRSISTRARITPTSFVNEYSWGDFKGQPDVWMERYFDAFLYLANWGTHLLKLRLPPRLLNPASALTYFGSDSAFVNVKSGKGLAAPGRPARPRGPRQMRRFSPAHRVVASGERAQTQLHQAARQGWLVMGLGWTGKKKGIAVAMPFSRGLSA
ncbi:hypothetical protein ACCAA_20208 [Candidatus Accumulibacter aalborgensis]|uniref:Uncharacterized protein n=1 Tax=Candidatus Accumulibacter aalborgensis TaxID=1860102 RepID=A0A1A8XJ55_9PROT|nr:hypothetical protein ACCAA_20208 [Candidatus Accumulibacter aalborgensis]